MQFKRVLLVFLLLVSAKFIYADQLAWITEEQAMTTVDYFKENKIKNVILWCACCDNDEKMKIKVTRIYYKSIENEPYFQVWIEGKDKDGKRLKQGVDLAYVHIKKAGEWSSVGTVMGFECDPCTKSFKY